MGGIVFMETIHVNLQETSIKSIQKNNITYINDDYIGDDETYTIYFKEHLGFFLISQD